MRRAGLFLFNTKVTTAVLSWAIDTGLSATINMGVAVNTVAAADIVYSGGLAVIVVRDAQ